MTLKIAENLANSAMPINKSVFTVAWEYVDEKEKRALMFKCLSILEAADFEKCFSELSQWYSGFCDRSKKHSVELPNNEENQKLAKQLQDVSYITSYKLQEKEIYDSVTETKKEKEYSCVLDKSNQGIKRSFIVFSEIKVGYKKTDFFK